MIRLIRLVLEGRGFIGSLVGLRPFPGAGPVDAFPTYRGPGLCAVCLAGGHPGGNPWVRCGYGAIRHCRAGRSSAR